MSLLYKLLFFAFIMLNIYEHSCASLEYSPADNKINKKNNDDYFYDEGLSDADKEKMREDRKLEEEQNLKEMTTTTEKTPDWFVRPNKSDDTLKEFMEEAIKEYMKKMRDEYMEKMKSKKESDINHPFWSVVTLVIFFGSGIVIGLSIVMIRGSKFQNNKLRKKSTAVNRSNNTSHTNNNKTTAYTSVPQTELTI